MPNERRKGPWIVKGSRQVFRNPWVEVVEDDVVGPNGKPTVFGVVKIRSGASVLAMDDEGNVYLTKEFHYGVGEETIEVVSGGADDGEEPIETAKRELKEEIGIEASDWKDLGIVHPPTTNAISPSRIFLARDLTFSEPSPEENEQIKMLKVPFDEAVRMVMDSEITHAASCVVIMKANEYLRNHPT